MRDCTDPDALCTRTFSLLSYLLYLTCSYVAVLRIIWYHKCYIHVRRFILLLAHASNERIIEKALSHDRDESRS